MESISGTRPPAETAAPTRAATPSSTVVAGPKAVKPVDKINETNSQPKKQADSPELRRTLQKLEERLSVNVTFDIAFDDSIKREVVRGVSNITGETVIEFPSEQMQRLIRGLRDELGLSVDKRA